MSEKNFKEDDYLASTHYQSKPKSESMSDFTVFNHDNQSYFGLLDANGNVVLRSEGYSTEAARDNGMQSIMKNKTENKRWGIDEKRGYHFITLKAGNHQEIGRSPVFRSKSDAEKAMASYMKNGSMTVNSGATSAATKTSPNEASVSAKTGNVRSGWSPNDTRVPRIVKSSNGVEISRRVVSIRRTVAKDDAYMNTAAYKGHKITDQKNRVALFTANNNQHYFAVYNQDGSVKLKSEGYTKKESLQIELTSTLENMNNKAMYATHKVGEDNVQILKDRLGREVARTCIK